MTYLDKYRALCNQTLGKNDDDNDNEHQLHAGIVRQIVLAKTNGLGDPSLLLNVYDGTVLTLPQLCKSTAAIVEKRSWTWKKEVSIEEFAERMTDQEEALPAARNVSEAKVLRIFAQDHPDVASLRRALLQNPYYQTKAMHFFHWNGRCRSAKEIQQAILKYPNSRRSMLKLIGLVLGALAVGAVALYTIRSSQGRTASARPDVLAAQPRVDTTKTATVLSEGPQSLNRARQENTAVIVTETTRHSPAVIAPPSLKQARQENIVFDPKTDMWRIRIAPRHPPTEDSVQIALNIYKENATVFDPNFVGDDPPLPGEEDRLTYVPYAEFRRQMDKAIDSFLAELALQPRGNVELWMPCFMEQQGFCFSKSNIWASLLALPRLTAYLTRVRIMNFKAFGMDYEQYIEWFPREQASKNTHVVLVDDGIYSGIQFRDVIESNIMDYFRKRPKEYSGVHFHVICPFVTDYFAKRVRTNSEEISWCRTHFKLYSSVIMKTFFEQGKPMTNYYFAHKLPDGHSSTALRIHKETQRPPYKRYQFTYNGRDIVPDKFREFYKIRHYDLIDYIKENSQQ